MRLLERKPDGELVLSEFTGKDIPIPAYAILSHTWATDNSEEVSFQDIEAGIGKTKAGYNKIRFCAKQAAADGLRYFWVDTCCIDKKNNTELSEAINSMFRWYQKATRCYVYLSDVSISDEQQSCQYSCFAWEAAFRKSRWFTRGWTLQELIAPTLLDFFSSEGERLGNKLSLEKMVHDITGIARNALKGNLLSDFSVDERMSWAAHRNTKLEEDEIYSLLGIFDISMPLIYGEGREKASKRLRAEVNKSCKGAEFDQFAVSLSLSAIPEPAQFVGREKELAEMHQLLYGHATRSIVILHGLGGMGKTQLTIAYARRYKAKYTAIFWINANDQGSLKLSFVDIAQQVLRDHPSDSVLASVDLEGNFDDVVNAVKAWLSIGKNARWLVIYDNYDNPKIPGNADRSAVDVRRFLPGSDHGSIIITTRLSQVTIGRRIQVQKLLNVQEGLEILSNSSGRKGVMDDPTAIALVEELDGLPLALSTAGACLEQVTMGFSEYLRLYKESWLKLQMTSPQLSSYEDRSLYTTWQLSLDRIERQNALSAKLLKLWAYFDRQDVWFELLQHGSSACHDWIQKLTEDKLSFNEAVRLLCNYGIVDPDLSFHKQCRSRGYSMHSCVHSWTVSVLNKEWDESLAKLALTCIASEIPSNDEKDWWLLQRRLLRHALRHEQFITDSKVKTEGMEWTLCCLGDLYRNQGKLAEAEAMVIRALQGYEETLGPKHTSTLDTVNNLGVLYKDQGKLAEAEAIYTRALQGSEEALRPKHTSTLNTINNLGVFYRNQDKLTEAEAMYTRALQGREKALGPKHTSTLDIVNNLGLLYADQGKLAEAEAMYTRALQGSEKALGPKHTSTLATVNNLGVLYKNQGKLAEAEAMYTRALQGYEEALGLKLVSSYIPALNTMVNLGNLYSKTSEKDMARTVYTRALSGFATVQGPLSDRCRELERRLEVLDLTGDSESLVRKFLRKIRR